MSNKRRTIMAMVLATLFIALSIGCSKHPNDDAIAKGIQTKIAADSATNDSQVHVTAKDGKVTLSAPQRVKPRSKEQNRSLVKNLELLALMIRPPYRPCPLHQNSLPPHRWPQCHLKRRNLNRSRLFFLQVRVLHLDSSRL